VKVLTATEKQKLEKYLIELIQHVEYSELITVENNIPHIRPMIYVNRGLIIFMATHRQTAKVEQIRKNPHVSVIIIKSFQTASETKEVIIEGTAQFVTDGKEREWVFEAFQQKPPTFQEWREGNPADYEVIKITPRLIKYFDHASKESEPTILQLD